MEKDQGQEEKKSTFKRVRLGDNLYMFDKDDIIPRITVQKITNVTLLENRNIQIECQYSVFSYEFSAERVDESEYHYKNSSVFLDKKVCDKKFEEFCISRIADLAKQLGTRRVIIKRSEIKCAECGGLPELVTEDSPHIVACNKCGKETISWAYPHEAWTQWEIDNDKEKL